MVLAFANSRTKHPFCCCRAPKGYPTMRAAALYSAAGSLLLTTLTATCGHRYAGRSRRPRGRVDRHHAGRRARPGRGHHLREVPGRAGPARRHGVRHGLRPARLRAPRRQADQADRQPRPGHPQGPAQQQAQSARPGLPGLQPRRPRRLRPLLPADRHAPRVEAHRVGLRPRRLRPARRRQVGAAVLRGPQALLQGALAVSRRTPRSRTRRNASRRPRATRAAAPSAPAASSASTTP